MTISQPGQRLGGCVAGRWGQSKQLSGCQDPDGCEEEEGEGGGTRADVHCGREKAKSSRRTSLLSGGLC